MIQVTTLIYKPVIIQTQLNNWEDNMKTLKDLDFAEIVILIVLFVAIIICFTDGILISTIVIGAAFPFIFLTLIVIDEITEYKSNKGPK